jgi:hypothetical protein
MTTPAVVLSTIESGKTISGLTMSDFMAALNSLSAASLSPSSSALWSGQTVLGGNPVSGGKVWPNLANQTGLTTLENTPRAQFLQTYNDIVVAQAAEIYQSEPYGYSLSEARLQASYLMGFTPAGGADITSTQITASIWGQASADYTSTLVGNVAFFGPNASIGRTFGAVELPDVLAGGTGITAINGIPVPVLQGIYYSSGLPSTFNYIQTVTQDALGTNGMYSVQSTSSDGSVTTNYFLTSQGAAALGLNPATVPGAISAADVSSIENAQLVTPVITSTTTPSAPAVILEDNNGTSAPTIADVAAEGGSFMDNVYAYAPGALKLGGEGLMALDTYLSTNQAAQYIQNGLYTNATQTLTALYARIYGAVEGFAIGSAALGGPEEPAGLLGGLGGMIYGAYAGNLTVNQVFAFGRWAVDNLTVSDPDVDLAVSLATAEGLILPSGTPSDVSSGLAQLIDNDYNAAGGANSGQSLAAYAQQVQTEAQQNGAATYSTSGTGTPLATIMGDPIGTADPSVTTFNANGIAQSQVTTNQNGLSVVNVYNQGSVVVGDAFESSGLQAALINDGTSGNQLNSLFDTNGDLTDIDLANSVTGSIISPSYSPDKLVPDLLWSCNVSRRAHPRLVDPHFRPYLSGVRG